MPRAIRHPKANRSQRRVYGNCWRVECLGGRRVSPGRRLRPGKRLPAGSRRQEPGKPAEPPVRSRLSPLGMATRPARERQSEENSRAFDVARSGTIVPDWGSDASRTFSAGAGSQSRAVPVVEPTRIDERSVTTAPRPAGSNGSGPTRSSTSLERSAGAAIVPCPGRPEKLARIPPGTGRPDRSRRPIRRV